MSLSLICWVFNDKLEQFFTVYVPKTNPVIQFKDLVKEKRSVRLGNVDATDLALWKVPFPIKDLMQFDFGQPKLAPLQLMSDIFVEQPSMDHVHVIVMVPTISPSKSDSSVHIDDSWARRKTTVEIIYSILNSQRLVQIRGTPGSGKTTLLKLLQHHITDVEPAARTTIISSWFRDGSSTKNAGERLSSFVPGFPSENPVKSYILFDNGQDTYWDWDLWENILKEHQGRDHGYCIILFCSYGSPGKRAVQYDRGTPPAVPAHARISMQRRNNFEIDREPVGLLLNREEYDDLVKRSPVNLDPSLQDIIFRWTAGHVGAIKSILGSLSFQFVAKVRSGVALTSTDFNRIDAAAFWRYIGEGSSFGRGLPTRGELSDVMVAGVLWDVLINKAIWRTMKSIETEANEPLRRCHKNGWIHSDTVDDEMVFYTLPSPLHMSYLSWKLIPPQQVIQYETLLDLTIATIGLFIPSQLLTPARRLWGEPTDHPPEAQYQQEFYRGLFELIGGSFVSPEYATEKDAPRLSRIDFFIEAKGWGIELLRDENNLIGHDSRFDVVDRVYGPWIPINHMVDYVILDFRLTKPRVAHPDILNLYHVVFEDLYHRFTLLDNNLKVVHTGALIEK